jgi:hypothetical protein
MKVNGFTEEGMKDGSQNMAATFGTAIFCSLLLTIALHPMVIHQWGFFSSLMTPENMNDKHEFIGDAATYVADYTAKYGNNFRTFGHGAFHGIINSIFLALPLIAINAVFERRGAKYIFIHWGYWTLTLMGMCAVICGMK